MKSWMIYQDIQNMKKDHLKKSQVARRLGIDYKTVSKYWHMPPGQFAEATNRAARRRKKADDYHDYVVQCLRNYPDMSAAQIYDWIKEKEGMKKNPFGMRTFRNYVADIRKKYDIPKPETSRQYEAVEELPMGKQAQVDMGEISLETINGRHKKIYAFGMVLAHSRYKYILWQTRPWTTADFVDAHIKAFNFFGGRPEEVVYDQDKIVSVSENHGDIILTEGFQNYVDAIGFKVVLCRAADPESKGKIENVIKYAKHGFAEHRVFDDIDTFNKDCIAWLNRTANAEEHGTTKKVPAEVFEAEKEHLIPVPVYSFAKPSADNITYHVRKDNTVLYKSNRYRVPVGTYSKGKLVYVVLQDETISIIDADTGVLYAQHPLCTGKGELIGDSSRKYRDKSKSILELEESTIELFKDSELIRNFLNVIHIEKRRYYRDQLGVIRSLFTEWDSDLINKALTYCLEHELYSAGELSSAVSYMASLELENKDISIPDKNTQLPAKYIGNGPQIRSLSEYEEAMRR